jgi:hypothetical protein
MSAKYPSYTQTSFVHHVQLGLKGEDVELIEKLCPATIYDRMIEEIEQKDKALEAKLTQVES